MVLGLSPSKKLLYSLLQGSIGDKFCCGEFKPCDGGHIGFFEPFFYKCSFISDAIFSHDRISHQLMCNGAAPLIGKVLVLLLHNKINLIFDKIFLFGKFCKSLRSIQTKSLNNSKNIKIPLESIKTNCAQI
jgi:hypothetical protein